VSAVDTTPARPAPDAAHLRVESPRVMRSPSLFMPRPSGAPPKPSSRLLDVVTARQPFRGWVVVLQVLRPLEMRSGEFRLLLLVTDGRYSVAVNLSPEWIESQLEMTPLVAEAARDDPARCHLWEGALQKAAESLAVLTPGVALITPADSAAPMHAAISAFRNALTTNCEVDPSVFPTLSSVTPDDVTDLASRLGQLGV
jgi:hypothetical protein